MEIFIGYKKFNKDELLQTIFKRDSFFIEEGKNLLIQEFGKEYGIYFSILEMISSGKTSRSEMESTLEKTIGGYLDRLEHQYDMLKKVKPVGIKK